MGIHKKSDEDLTSREMEVLILSAWGHSQKKIADKLFISYGTVAFHRNNIYSKTKCSNTLELLVYAIEKGFISLNKKTNVTINIVNVNPSGIFKTAKAMDWYYTSDIN